MLGIWLNQQANHAFDHYLLLDESILGNKTQTTDDQNYLLIRSDHCY